MDSHQQVEVSFWKNLVQRLGQNGFIAQRSKDFIDNNQGFDNRMVGNGKTLEVGSGLFSFLEWLGGEVVAVDPLMDEYVKLLNEFRIEQKNVDLKQASGEKLPFMPGTFNQVVCINVIDHTPDPEKMVKEIKRVLKNDGLFFFEVHFDDHLSPAHYGLWNEQKVVEVVEPYFEPIYENIFRNPHYPQRKCYKIYKKR
jgi:SAM-dependent methyltransferase